MAPAEAGLFTQAAEEALAPPAEQPAAPAPEPAPLADPAPAQPEAQHEHAAQANGTAPGRRCDPLRHPQARPGRPRRDRRFREQGRGREASPAPSWAESAEPRSRPSGRSSKAASCGPRRSSRSTWSRRPRPSGAAPRCARARSNLAPSGAGFREKSYDFSRRVPNVDMSVSGRGQSPHPRLLLLLPYYVVADSARLASSCRSSPSVLRDVCRRNETAAPVRCL